jgi:hypothetical protein
MKFKIPIKNEEKKSRLFRWLTNLSRSLAGRYVNDCHPVFMQYLAVNNIATASIWNDARSRRYKEIIKILDSDKYRKFFYKAISYNPKNREYEKLEVKWYVKIFDKAIYRLSKAYVFLFERELYRKIKTFETVSAGVASLTKRMDEYIAKTTPEQRLSRMQALGIISYESFKDDLDVIFNRISPDVIEARNNEKYETNPGTFGSQFSIMNRKLPRGVSNQSSIV